MKVFAIGDIHGGLKALVQLLNALEVKSEDKLIFLGDYVDGWSESAQVIQFLLELSEEITCVFIKGNHDVWCENWLRTGDVNPTWYLHGGMETLESYEGVSDEDKHKHLEFFENMSIYYIDDNNRLFVHAGFTSMHGVEREAHIDTCYFDRTLLEAALAVDENISSSSELYPQRLKLYKEIYIGHTPTTRLNSDKPIQAVNVWDVDTGAAFKGRLSAINIDTKEIYQSDAVYSLYPDEMGRNKS